MIKVNAIAVSCDQQYCRLYCLDFYNFFIVAVFLYHKYAGRIFAAWGVNTTLSEVNCANGTTKKIMEIYGIKMCSIWHPLDL